MVLATRPLTNEERQAPLGLDPKPDGKPAVVPLDPLPLRTLLDLERALEGWRAGTLLTADVDAIVQDLRLHATDREETEDEIGELFDVSGFSATLVPSPPKKSRKGRAAKSA